MLVAPALLLLPLLRPVGGAHCPASCRCYSLAVECGSAGLRAVPQGAPPHTQTLFLQDNLIGQIRTNDLILLTHLNYLYLQNNTLSSVEPGSFQKQKRLVELALNANLLHSLSADIFQGLEQLRILYLAANRITRLQDHTFRGLQRLQELHLQHNILEVVSERAMLGLSSLALLDLSANNLHTIGATVLRPLVSLQVLRITDNPWRCDCALHWLRSWMDEAGRRLLSSAERRLLCAEPPRLSSLSLLEVPPNSLVCIPPLLQLEPRRLAIRLGESLRVSCHASGYPRPQVTWKKASQGKVVLSPRGLVQEVLVGGAPGPQEVSVGRALEDGGSAGRFDPDTGSGMLFLSNVTMAHAGFYECEAWNAGGVARVTFQLAINSSSSSSSVWASWPRPRGPASPPDVSREPLHALGSMAFGALGTATQTAIAAGISLLTLTALLLLAMIYSRRCHGDKEGGSAHKEESILYVNDYSDGPTTFAQLEEFRDGRGHEMFVLNRAGPAPSKEEEPEEEEEEPEESRVMGEGGEARPAVAPETEAILLGNAGLFLDSHIAYEIHC